jgi:hypothetical protein
MRKIKVGVAGLGAAALVFAGAGVAAAVSGGGYSPSQQDCPANADANNAGQPGSSVPAAVPGCHNFAINAGSGQTRYASLGVDQIPNNASGSSSLPHSGCVAANTNGTGGGQGAPGDGCGTGSGTGGTIVFNAFNPTGTTVSPQTGTPAVASFLQNAAGNGVYMYLGADDNLDFGEHDGVSGTQGTSQSINGPSDGGAVNVSVNPQRAGATPTATNPLPIFTAAEGMCADGTCVEFTTYQQTIYHGGANGQNRDVYNYQGKQWDPYNCSSGSLQSERPGPQGCGNRTMDQWRAQEAQNVNAEPGVQVYEDPDPQGSPAGPTQAYPLPAAYAGTCGVVAGGGAAQAPPSPLTNSAGQVVVAPTGC